MCLILLSASKDACICEPYFGSATHFLWFKASLKNSIQNLTRFENMFHLSIEYRFSNKPTSNRLEHPLIVLLETVYESGSISKAAKRLGLSYRYVWGELKHWESELNTSLIIWGRTSKGATLTPEAIEFLSEVSKTHIDLAPQVAEIKNRVEQCVSVLKNSRSIVRASH